MSAELTETPLRDMDAAATHVTIEYDWWIAMENHMYANGVTSKISTINTPILKDDGEFEPEWGELQDAVRTAAPSEVIHAALDILNRPEFTGLVGTAVRKAVSSLVNQMEHTWSLGDRLTKLHEKQTTPLPKSAEVDMWDAAEGRTIRTYGQPTRNELRMMIRVMPPYFDACQRLSKELKALDSPAMTLHVLRPRDGKSPNAFQWGELGFGRLEHGAEQVADVWGLDMVANLQPTRMELEIAREAILDLLDVAEAYEGTGVDQGKVLPWDETVRVLREELDAADWLISKIPLHGVIAALRPPAVDGLEGDTLLGNLPVKNFVPWESVLPDLPNAGTSRHVRPNEKRHSLYDALVEDRFALTGKKKRWSLRTILTGEVPVGVNADKTAKVQKVPEMPMSAEERAKATKEGNEPYEGDGWMLPSELKAALLGALGIKSMQEYFKFVADRLGWLNALGQVQPPKPWPILNGLAAVDNGQDINIDPRLVLMGFAVSLHGGMTILHSPSTATIAEWDSTKVGNGGAMYTTLPVPMKITDPSSDEYPLLTHKPSWLFRGEKDSMVKDVNPPTRNKNDVVAMKPFELWVERVKKRGLDKVRAERSDEAEIDEEASAQVVYTLFNAYIGDKREEVVAAMKKSVESDGIDASVAAHYKTLPGYQHHLALIMRLQVRRALIWFGGYCVCYDTCRSTMLLSSERIGKLALPHKLSELGGVMAATFAAYDTRPIVANDPKGEG